MLFSKLVFRIQSLRYYCSLLHDAFSEGKLLRERKRSFSCVRYVYTNVAHRDGRTKSKSCRGREGGEQDGENMGDGEGGERARCLYRVVFRSMQEDFWLTDRNKSHSLRMMLRCITWGGKRRNGKMKNMHILSFLSPNFVIPLTKFILLDDRLFLLSPPFLLVLLLSDESAKVVTTRITNSVSALYDTSRIERKWDGEGNNSLRALCKY